MVGLITQANKTYRDPLFIYDRETSKLGSINKLSTESMK